MYCTCAGYLGTGRQGSEQGRLLKRLCHRNGSWGTKYLPNSKSYPTQMCILHLKAELEESGQPCMGWLGWEGAGRVSFKKKHLEAFTAREAWDPIGHTPNGN